MNIQHPLLRRVGPLVVLLCGVGVSGCGSESNDKVPEITRCEPAATPVVAAPAALPPVTPPAAAPVALAAPVVAPKADLPARTASKNLEVKRLVIGTGVDRTDRKPTGVAERFRSSEFERIYAYVELANPGAETDIVVHFEPPGDGPSKGRVELAVGSSPRWRTWAFSRAVAGEGTWDAVVSTSDGRELARTTFEITS